MIAAYAVDRVKKTARPKETAARLSRLNDYFGGMVAEEITPATCADYERQRGSEQAARRELEDLRAALRYAVRNRNLAVEIPVTLPEKSVPRDRWLTRAEAAALLAGALGWRRDGDRWKRDGERNPHVARFILLGIYTATRHGAILGLGWHEHTGGGFVDLDRAVLYRASRGARQTKKRRPPVAIPARLLAHLRRWAAMPKFLHIVTYDGGRLGKMKRAWATARAQAGLGEDVTPHVLRHTAITWHLHNGLTVWEVAGFAGATAEMIERVYGHHAETFGHRFEHRKKERSNARY